MSSDTGDGRRFPFDPGWFTEVEHDALCEAISELNGWEELEASYTVTKLTVDALCRAGKSPTEVREIVVGHAYDYTAGRKFPDDQRRRMILVARGLVSAVLEGHTS